MIVRKYMISQVLWRAFSACALALMLFTTSPLRAQDMPHGEGDPHAGVPGAPPRERQLATAAPSPEVPPGTIRVRVLEPTGAPVAGAEVNIGTMGAEGRRERVLRRTDASGTATFAGLPTGAVQAYRVNLPYQGANYGSTPFRLPEDQGYDVALIRLPTTRDPGAVLLVRGELSLELREGRLHVSQRAQLMNLGEETYLFPAEGLAIPLPAGFTAPQTEPVMTDQKLIGDAQGYRLMGSLPPGAVLLSWAYDLPLEGAAQTVEVPVPFRTYLFRVLSDAPAGATLTVESVVRGTRADGSPVSQFSATETVENEGRRIFLSQLERTPADPPLVAVRARYAGLPTPGPLRWIASFGALALALVGGFGAFRAGRTQSGDALATRKESLLAALATLASQRASGEVGPRTFEQERARLMDELAETLRAEERRALESSRSPEKSAPPVSPAKGRASR